VTSSFFLARFFLPLNLISSKLRNLVPLPIQGSAGKPPDPLSLPDVIFSVFSRP